jgi:hypothetical protein
MKLRIRLARALRAVADRLSPMVEPTPSVQWTFSGPTWPNTIGPLNPPSAMCPKCGAGFVGTHACLGPLTSAPVIRWVNS